MIIIMNILLLKEKTLNALKPQINKGLIKLTASRSKERNYK